MIPNMQRLAETRAFCGPFALAALTGEPIDRCLDAIRAVRGDDNEYRERIGAAPRRRGVAIRGVYNWEMDRALKTLGWRMDAVPHKSKISMKRFVETIGMALKDSPLLVNVTGHYIVLYRGMVMDTTYRIPMAFSLSRRYRRSIVRNAWAVKRAAAVAGG